MLRPKPLKKASHRTKNRISSESSQAVPKTPKSGKDVVLLSPSVKPPIPWSLVVPTHRREKAIEGLLMGCAIAESLSLARHGIHPRLGLKLFGRPPIRYEYLPGIGLPSERTHGMIMAIQSMLCSRADSQLFSSQISKRTTWYQRAFPLRRLGIKMGNAIAFPTRNKMERQTYALGDDLLIRSIVISVMLQGCTNSALRWFQRGIAATHSAPNAIQLGLLVGYSAQLALIQNQDNLTAVNIVDKLIPSIEDPHLRAVFIRMRSMLEERRSVNYVAKTFGWSDGLPSNMFASAVMGIYAWLRHSQSYRDSVERTIMLGGSCRNAAVIAGSLSGISLSTKKIPSHWMKSLSFYPYNKSWQENLIERVKDWPHGVEDIQRSHGVPSHLFGQLIRNLMFIPPNIIHAAIRFPMRLIQFGYHKRIKSK